MPVPQTDLEALLDLNAFAHGVQTDWLTLMQVLVFGDLKSKNVGALPKARKRALELGEKWRSLFAPRDWIPKPREQLKNALGSALALRDALNNFERAAQDIDGGKDFSALSDIIIRMHRLATGPLAERENAWATALAALNRAGLEDTGD